MSRRLYALLSMVAFGAACLCLVWAAATNFPRDIVAPLLLIAAGFVVWTGLVRSTRMRIGLWISASALATASLVIAVADGLQLLTIIAFALFGAAGFLAKLTFVVHLHLPPARRPEHAVLIFNPKSGGGKAGRFHLADEARKRGITPIELGPADDLSALAEKAVAAGADGLMVAGGDGTQAIVAAVAAEHDLPFACVPAGTRNHFALDLGVDRKDVVGALDAFVNGGEKRVDLGVVGGRVFVNNVSMGIYAEAIQREGYREAKIRTLIGTVPDLLSSTEAKRGTATLSWIGPDQQRQSSAAVILVSNNVYRLGTPIGSGTRPRMDAGVLGVTVVGAATAEIGSRAVTTSWSEPEFTVDTSGEIPIGVDGEALTMSGPLIFRIRPAALRVRIAHQHPGASPSAAMPTDLRDAAVRLWRIMRGSDPTDASVGRHR